MTQTDEDELIQSSDAEVDRLVEALQRVTAERDELKQKVKSMQKVISGMYSGDIKKFCDGVNEASIG